MKLDDLLLVTITISLNKEPPEDFAGSREISGYFVADMQLFYLLEEMAAAVNEQRLFGFMQEWAARLAFGADDKAP